jgi:hypothetical protein
MKAIVRPTVTYENTFILEEHLQHLRGREIEVKPSEGGFRGGFPSGTKWYWRKDQLYVNGQVVDNMEK